MPKNEDLFVLSDKACETLLHHQGLSFRDAGQTSGYVQALQVRGMLAAYEVSGKKEYLEAARAWADLTIHLQGTHGHPDAYNMGYHLQVDRGIPEDWYVADTTTVASGLCNVAHVIGRKDPLYAKILDSLYRYLTYINREWKSRDGGYGLGYIKFRKERPGRSYHCAVAEGLLFLAAFHQLTGHRNLLSRGREVLACQLAGNTYNSRYNGGPVLNRAYQGEALIASLSALAGKTPRFRRGIIRHFRELIVPWAVRTQAKSGCWMDDRRPGVVVGKTAGLIMVLQLILPLVDGGEKHREALRRGYAYLEKSMKVQDDVGRPLGEFHALAFAARDYPEAIFPNVIVR